METFLGKFNHDFRERNKRALGALCRSEVHTQEEKEHIRAGIARYEKFRYSHPFTLSAVVPTSDVDDTTFEFLRDFEPKTSSPTGGLYRLGQYVGVGKDYSILLELSCSKSKDSECRTCFHRQIPRESRVFIFNFGGLSRFFFARYNRKVEGVSMHDLVPSVFTLADPESMLVDGRYSYTWLSESMSIRAALK
eukprot:CAMPEP_0171784384 /NCGR_PEP_ID=MMETSP0991-20121206/62052_1 /TAXON_ID=483369 /ORGANISM="non described non described, Strain CCMP2098" /LENGTH=192 /DNA_ID=CAMNT_0012392693 /DNA_START=71 /DNA_END=646 /DNA_ORIENTATION=+